MTVSTSTRKPTFRALTSALLVAMSVLPASPGMAEIYKTVNADGTVTYTDRPTPGQKTAPVKIDGGNVYTTARVPYDGKPGEQQQGAVAPVVEGYTSVSITSPANQASFHSNEGIVPLSFQILPPLRAGDSVQVILDGRLFPITMNAQGIGQLSNIDRGAHTLAVNVLDPRGKPVLSSTPVTFFVHKTSVLLGPNKAKPGSPARRPGGAVVTPPKPATS